MKILKILAKMIIASPIVLHVGKYFPQENMKGRIFCSVCLKMPGFLNKR